MAHVVVVDADYSIRKLLKHAVNLLGWTCDTAESGLGAWLLVEKQRPDVVIAEVNLSSMSGVGLVRSMKLDPLCRDVPVILTGSAHREDLARDVGCAAFLAKPFGIDALLLLLACLAPEEERNNCQRGRSGLEGGYPLSHWGP